MKRLELGPRGIRTLLVLGLLAAVKAATLVGIATAVATGLVSTIAGDTEWRDAVVLGIASALVRALVTWATQAYSARAVAATKETIRRDLATRLLAGGDRSVGGETTAATVALDELDTYFTTVLPAITTTAVVPLLVGARILAADWVSALVIVITVPLVPVFMALVGMHTQQKTDAASATLRRLSDTLVELARGLPVLVGLGRVDEQAAALRGVSERHRVSTMATLRTAFLSSLVLELISTISVAVVAVFVGLRLVNGDLPLEVGLLALVLAPECFAPFRELGSAFHASQDGLAALRRAREVIATPVAAGRRFAGARLRVESLTVRYDERTVIDGIDFIVPRGTIAALQGASGSGKTTILGALAGIVEASDGVITGVDADRVAWVPQHPQTVGATVRDELALYAGSAVGVDRVMLQLDLAAVAASDPARLSPGELRRVAVARGLLRVEAGADVLLLDEPTAHLDPAHARVVEELIEGLRGRVTVVFASHESGMARIADQVILVGSGGGTRATDDTPPALTTATRDTAETAAGNPLRELAVFLRGMGPRLPLSLALGAATATFGAALTALSGWLIVRASEQPSIMYLTVAIVGVRFFGIGRAALRYAERLATHDAVLASVTQLRLRLWFGFARRGVASRSLASGPVALDYIVSAADQVRDRVPRVVLPAVVAVVVSAAAIVATVTLYSPAVPVAVGLVVVALLVAPVAAVVADRTDATATRSTMLQQFGRAVAASDDLRANAVTPRVLDRLALLDRTATRLARRSALARGLGDAVTVAAAGIASMLMIATIAPAVGDGSLGGPIAGVLVLLPLAVLEPLLGAVAAVQQWPGLRTALARVGGVASDSLDPLQTVDRVTELELVDLAVAWPGSTPLATVNATARRGDWIVVEGPSGAGKSTLLATIMGFVAPASGDLLVNGRGAVPTVAWSPQDSHIFDSTVRGNLVLARSRNDSPSDDDLRRALDLVGLDIDLESRVGAGGTHLSGGERQRLAVARTVLTRADVVLLDEPTAHLDEANATRLMAALREELADRIVVLVSHHADERQWADAVVTVGSGAELDVVRT